MNNYVRINMGEKGLWAVVLVTALRDACGYPTGLNGKGSAVAATQCARHWLTTKNGDTYHDRIEILDNISLDEDVFDKLIKRLESSGWNKKLLKSIIDNAMRSIYSNNKFYTKTMEQHGMVA
jgi:hypothetical protein